MSQIPPTIEPPTDQSSFYTPQSQLVMINDPTVLFLNVGYNNIPIDPVPGHPFSFHTKTYDAMFGLSSVPNPSTPNQTTALSPRQFQQATGPTPELLYIWPNHPTTSDIFIPGHYESLLQQELSSMKNDFSQATQPLPNPPVATSNSSSITITHPDNLLPPQLQIECQQLLDQYYVESTPSSSSALSAQINDLPPTYNPQTCAFRAQPTLHQLAHTFSPPQFLVLEAARRALLAPSQESRNDALPFLDRLVQDPINAPALHSLVVPTLPPQTSIIAKVRAHLSSLLGLAPPGMTAADLIGFATLPQTGVNTFAKSSSPVHFHTFSSFETPFIPSYPSVAHNLTDDFFNLLGKTCTQHLARSTGAYLNTPFVHPGFVSAQCGYNRYTANVFNLFNGIKGLVSRALAPTRTNDSNSTTIPTSTSSHNDNYHGNWSNNHDNLSLFPIQDICLPDINQSSMLFPHLHSLWFHQPNSYTLMHLYPALGWKDPDSFSATFQPSSSSPPTDAEASLSTEPPSSQTSTSPVTPSLSSFPPVSSSSMTSSSDSNRILATPLPRGLPHAAQASQVYLPITPCREYFPQSAHLAVSPPRSALHIFGQLWSNLANPAPQPYHIEQQQGYAAYGQLHSLPFTPCPLDLPTPNSLRNVPVWLQLFSQAQFFRRLQSGGFAHEVITAKKQNDSVSASMLAQYHAQFAKQQRQSPQKKPQQNDLQVRTTALRWMEQPLPCDNQCYVNDPHAAPDASSALQCDDSPALKPIIALSPSTPHRLSTNPPFFVPYSSFIFSFTDFHSFLPYADLPALDALHAFSASRLFEYDTIPLAVRNQIRDTPITNAHTLALCQQSQDFVGNANTSKSRSINRSQNNM